MRNAHFRFSCKQNNPIAYIFFHFKLIFSLIWLELWIDKNSFSGFSQVAFMCKILGCKTNLKNAAMFLPVFEDNQTKKGS